MIDELQYYNCIETHQNSTLLCHFKGYEDWKTISFLFLKGSASGVYVMYVSDDSSRNLYMFQFFSQNMIIFK